MRRWWGLAVFTVLAIVVVTLAVANRQPVTFFYWPGQGLELRLFALILLVGFGSFLLGRLLGGLKAAALKSRLRQAEQKITLLEQQIAEQQAMLPPIPPAIRADGDTTSVEPLSQQLGSHQQTAA